MGHENWLCKDVRVILNPSLYYLRSVMRVSWLLSIIMADLDLVVAYYACRALQPGVALLFHHGYTSMFLLYFQRCYSLLLHFGIFRRICWKGGQCHTPLKRKHKMNKYTEGHFTHSYFLPNLLNTHTHTYFLVST